MKPNTTAVDDELTRLADQATARARQLRMQSALCGIRTRGLAGACDAEESEAADALDVASHAILSGVTTTRSTTTKTVETPDRTRAKPVAPKRGRKLAGADIDNTDESEDD